VVLRLFFGCICVALCCLCLLVVKEINGIVNETVGLGSALACELRHLRHAMPVVLLGNGAI
jgi:hypothetical protein